MSMSLGVILAGSRCSYQRTLLSPVTTNWPSEETESELTMASFCQVLFTAPRQWPDRQYDEKSDVPDDRVGARVDLVHGTLAGAHEVVAVVCPPHTSQLPLQRLSSCSSSLSPAPLKETHCTSPATSALCTSALFSTSQSLTV